MEEPQSVQTGDARTASAKRMRSAGMVGVIGGTVIGFCAALVIVAPSRIFDDPTMSEVVAILCLCCALGTIVLPIVVSAIATRLHFLMAVVPLAIPFLWVIFSEVYALYTYPKRDDIWKAGTTIKHGAPNLAECLLYLATVWLVTSAPISFIKWGIALNNRRRGRRLAKTRDDESAFEGAWPPKPQA